MLSLFISPNAEADLDDIWSFVASRDALVADRLIDAITNQFQMFREMPDAGRQRNELRVGLRSFPVGSFLIFYQRTENTIEIVRVLHGARDIPSLLGESH